MPSLPVNSIAKVSRILVALLVLQSDGIMSHTLDDEILRFLQIWQPRNLHSWPIAWLLHYLRKKED